MATNLKIAGLMELQAQIKKKIITARAKRRELEDLLGGYEGAPEDTYNYLVELVEGWRKDREALATTNLKIEELVELEILLNKVAQTEQNKHRILDDLFSEFNLSLFKGTQEEAYECYHEYYLFREGITVEDVHEYLIELLAKQRGEPCPIGEGQEVNR